ncbi:MAG TPA: amidohydrolase family protein [Wenzhouxiangella sp.]
MQTTHLIQCQRPKSHRWWLLAILSLAISSTAWAELRQPTPNVHAIVDVRIVTEPGQIIESGTVVIRDGIIEAVGANVEAPADARIHRFEREQDQPPITIYPGLIEPHFQINTDPEESAGDSETPAGRHALVKPDARISAAHWPQDQVDQLRRAGFTTAVFAPSHGLLRGSGVVANLGDGGLSHNVIDPEFGQFASFEGRAGRRQFPSSLMGAVALVRQTFSDAAWQTSARAAWALNPAQPRPQWFEGLDELGRSINGGTPLVFSSEDLLDTLRILSFVQFDETRLAIVGHGAEYQRLDDITGTNALHIIPLNFPDAPDVKDENDRNVSLEALRHWHRAPDNPKALHEAGLELMFTSHGLSQPGEFVKNLAKAVERGLDPDVALAAVTTAPAQWLLLSDRAGKVAPGMMANLIVAEGDLISDNPKISDVWVDGHQFTLAAIKPPSVDPVGTWGLTLGLGGMGDVEAQLVLTGTPANIDGTLSVMGNDSPLTSAEISDDQLIATIDSSRFGGSGTITLKLTINGDSARGNGSGPFGEFTLRGQRQVATASPDQAITSTLIGEAQ